MEELLKQLQIVLKDLNLEHIARYVEDISKSVDKVHIAFVGEYNAGKSSIINTLLGERILAERDLPTTNRVVLVTHCPVEKKEKIDNFTELLCINNPKLENIVLVDTPGLSSAIEEHESALMHYLHKADLVVIVAPSNQPYTKEIEKLLELLSEKHSTQWAYVINIFEDPKVYEEDPTKITRLKEFVKEKLRNILSSEDVEKTPIFAFSLRLVREGNLEHPLAKEWKNFENFVFKEVAEKAKKLKYASIKEKILKAVSGEEILERQRTLEGLKRKRNYWQSLKEAVKKYAEKSLSERRKKIEQKLEMLFGELEKDIDEILEKIPPKEILKAPEKVEEEISETLRVKFMVTEHLSDIEKLLDYRPEFIRLKRIYPELVVEPTIPANLQTLKNNLIGDIEKLPYVAGKPGKVAKWLAPIGLLALIGGLVPLFTESPTSIKVISGIIAAFGGLIFLISVYRLLTVKKALETNLKNRIQNLKEHYKKLYTQYYKEKFEEKLQRVLDYIDENVERLNRRIGELENLLQKLDKLVYDITFKV